jgi:hypothetical protein
MNKKGLEVSSISLELNWSGLPDGRIEIWLLRDPALRIHHWGDGQRDSAEGEGGAASAAGVGTAYDKEVLVLDVAPGCLRLDVLQHEEVLWAPRDLLALLLSHGRRLSSNCLEVQGHQARLSC